MVHSLAPSRRRLVALVAVLAALFVCLAAATEAHARRDPAGSTQRHAASARSARRCSHARPRRRCVKSARLRRAHRRHRRTHKRAGGGETETAPTQQALESAAGANAPGAHGEACANTELVPSSSNIAQVREATLCLINEQREQHGELALAESSKLLAAAQGHSEDMVARDYFEHTTPTGEEFSTRIVATGYVPRGAAYELAENIDMATLSLSTPAATVNAWMNSPEHRANILNGELRETGVGIAPAAPAYFAEGQPGATYTQDFGVLAS